jgi:hypothetical protein
MSHEDGRRGTSEHVAMSKDEQTVLSRKYGAGTLVSQDADVENNICSSQTRLGLEEGDASCKAGKSPHRATSGLQEHHKQHHLERSHQHRHQHHHQYHHQRQHHLRHLRRQHQQRHFQPHSSAKTSTLAMRQGQRPTGRSPATLQVDNGVQREGVNVDPGSEFHCHEQSARNMHTEQFSRQRLSHADDQWTRSLVAGNTTVRALHAKTVAEPRGISSNRAGRQNGANQAPRQISSLWHPNASSPSCAHSETLRPTAKRSEPSAAGDRSILARPWWAHSY